MLRKRAKPHRRPGLLLCAVLVASITVPGCHAARSSTLGGSADSEGPSPPDAGYPPSIGGDNEAISGFLNAIADFKTAITTALEANTALNQKQEKAGRDHVTRISTDVWTNRLLACSWLVYPLVWRPTRARLRRWRNGNNPEESQGE